MLSFIYLLRIDFCHGRSLRAWCLGLVGRSDQPPYFHAQLLPVSANPSLLMYPRCPSDSLKYSINTCLSLCSFASLSAVSFACSLLLTSTALIACKSSCTTTVNLSIFINLLFYRLLSQPVNYIINLIGLKVKGFL